MLTSRSARQLERAPGGREPQQEHAAATARRADCPGHRLRHARRLDHEIEPLRDCIVGGEARSLTRAPLSEPLRGRPSLSGGDGLADGCLRMSRSLDDAQGDARLFGGLGGGRLADGGWFPVGVSQQRERWPGRSSGGAATCRTPASHTDSAA